MKNKFTSFFFSVVFLLFVAMPTIVFLADESVEVSVAFSSSEETKEIFELAFLNAGTVEPSVNYNSIEKYLDILFDTYSKPYINLVLPPPEQYF